MGSPVYSCALVVGSRLACHRNAFVPTRPTPKGCLPQSARLCREVPQRAAQHEPSLRGDLGPIPPGVLIFDTIDVCVNGFPAYSLPSFLPARRLVSFTAHNLGSGVLGDRPPTTWGPRETCTIYDLQPNSVAWTPFAIRKLEASARAEDVGTISILVRGAGWKPGLEKLASPESWELTGAVVNSWRPILKTRSSSSGMILMTSHAQHVKFAVRHTMLQASTDPQATVSAKVTTTRSVQKRRKIKGNSNGGKREEEIA